MIVVEANLFSARTGSEELLCQVVIANKTKVNGPLGDYSVKLYSRGDNPRLIRTAEVKNWPRKAKPAWRLIQAAFEALGE
jgi:hypothetical protein